MGTNLFANLPAVLKQYEQQLYDMVTDVVTTAALAGGTYLGVETPVDTGVARSNWVASIEQPFIGVIPAYVPYPSYRTNHHEAVKQVLIRRATPTKRAIKLFQPKFTIHKAGV